MGVHDRYSIPVAMPVYSPAEDRASFIIHGIALPGAAAGMVMLLRKTAGDGAAGGLDSVAVIVYSAAMMGMFLFSTLYHAARESGVKQILRKFDHAFVFIFIGGGYTPYCLVGLRGAWGWSIVAVIWSMAIFGIALDLFGSKSLKKMQVAIFLIMGWAIVVGFFPLVRALPAISMVLLVAGGIVFTLGTRWYRRKGIEFTHVVWHGFVLAGAVCHWFSIWFFI